MNARIVSARGAVNIPEELDEKLATVDAVGRLIRALAKSNGFLPTDLVNLMFTQTTDLLEKNAAAALRESAPEYSSVPLFCSLEPNVRNAPGRMVRVLATWYGEAPGKPVYLDDAALLRPDLFQES